jgi:hypothetical protein
VSGDFKRAVHRQLEAFATQAGTPWALLMDPVETHIFWRSEPFMTLPTEEIVRNALTVEPQVIGEQTLLLAVARWLELLPHHQELLRRYPKLETFALDVKDAELASEGS